MFLNKTAKEILEKLESNGYIAYIVGGYVRDFLLGKITNDIDICTDATTKEVMELFRGNANEYGSFNLKANEFNIDITTFREEQNYENRRPTSILYTKDLKTDLLRRDFTINTICMDKNEHVKWQERFGRAKNPNGWQCTYKTKRRSIANITSYPFCHHS